MFVHVGRRAEHSLRASAGRVGARSAARSWPSLIHGSPASPRSSWNALPASRDRRSVFAGRTGPPPSAWWQCAGRGLSASLPRGRRTVAIAPKRGHERWLWPRLGKAWGGPCEHGPALLRLSRAAGRRGLLVLAGGGADESGDHEPAAAHPEDDQEPQGLDGVEDHQGAAGEEPQDH